MAIDGGSYINVFRSPQQMGSQSGYFCVTIYAAAAFIENLTSEQLTIDHDFFRDQLGQAFPSQPSADEHHDAEYHTTGSSDKDSQVTMQEGHPTEHNNNTSALPSPPTSLYATNNERDPFESLSGSTYIAYYPCNHLTPFQTLTWNLFCWP